MQIITIIDLESSNDVEPSIHQITIQHHVRRAIAPQAPRGMNMMTALPSKRTNPPSRIRRWQLTLAICTK